MKRIDTYITEKLHINNTTKIEYMYHPKTKDELIGYINKKIRKEGLGTKENPLDLNDIDTSKITDMSNLFDIEAGDLKELSENGNFDISDWDVSNVEWMNSMFYGSNFDGDISDWKLKCVKTVRWMFAYSKFTSKNGDISKWNLNLNVDKEHMFYRCPLQNNLPKWQV